MLQSMGLQRVGHDLAGEQQSAINLGQFQILLLIKSATREILNTLDNIKKMKNMH